MAYNHISSANLKTECFIDTQFNQELDLSLADDYEPVTFENIEPQTKKSKKCYDFLVVANTCKGHSQQDPAGSLRSDVLYKTIIRDMRKFYSTDFNDETGYIKRKRYRGNDYFAKSLDSYLAKKFPEIYTSFKNLGEI